MRANVRTNKIRKKLKPAIERPRHSVTGLKKLFKTLLAAINVATQEAEARTHAESLALELAEAVAERDRFIDIAAHELKTPLTALKLQLQLNARVLDQSTEATFDAEKSRKSLDQALRQCDRLGRLIENILDVSRIHAGRMVIRKKTECISDLLLRTVEDHRSDLSSAGCEMSLDVEPGIEATVDGERLSRVFSCLFSNVARHAPEGEVEISLFRKDTKIITKVRDFGPGVPPEQSDAIFGRGAVLQDLSGLGLSLHICRAIARAHGGELAVNDDWMDGAEFVLEIPAN